MKNKAIPIISFLVFCLILPCSAQEGKGKVRRATLAKAVQGTVTWARKDKIAVLYATTNAAEYEILLMLAKDVKFVHISKLEQLHMGDTVSVQYEEAIEEGPQGNKASRRAKVITFIKAAEQKPIKPAAEEAPEDESGLLKSD